MDLLGALFPITGLLLLLMVSNLDFLNLLEGLNREILCLQDMFSRGICSLFNRGLCQRYHTSGSGLAPTHLFFADDALQFCRADGPSASNLMDFIERYEASSGQRMGRNKCSYYRQSSDRNGFLERRTGFSKGS